MDQVLIQVVAIIGLVVAIISGWLSHKNSRKAREGVARGGGGGESMKPPPQPSPPRTSR